MDSDFAFKELKVWQMSIDFADIILDLVENLNSSFKHYRLVEQIEASSVSISSNIAEGKGRESKKEYIRFLYIARGSLYESISILTLFEKRKWITKEVLEKLEKMGIEIASMLKGLIKAIARTL
ncbi:four helix bundle protein [Algoriphagus machipongonensis]|uniref:S23 ribosomal protein n=1 Tax=Algoriphagus machipongonensis TaxID=388413 RepID=A3HRQ0_9BACT|nr:four helix bundle protein [Algoriphagus machipongonensis]EAZ82518.1 S23 ribosomal protein [Algoriphagus machipongonensis]